ncbi:MAG: pyridoxine 5'-phosphate synthase [Rickettsiales bacterium]|nr:pyridoxine 5'-phosphate synthase [Rickettsiales bacterium]
MRLGVNIDHVATLRNARGTDYPDLLEAANIVLRAGADGITVHLREDRRHIKDKDLKILLQNISRPINLEIAPTNEMISIAIKHKPHACCLVPEKRRELTTEGGLDLLKLESRLCPKIKKLQDAGIKVSLFINPDFSQIEAASRTGSSAVELHTGSYSDCNNSKRKKEHKRILDAAKFSKQFKIECHAGHGLTHNNVTPIAKISEITELNIGHSLISESIFIGLRESVKRMKDLIQSCRRKYYKK